MSNRLCDVRRAHHDDVSGIYKTLIQALTEARVQLPAPDDPYCRQYTHDLIDQGLVWVAVDPRGQVVGVLMLGWSRWPWTAPANIEAHFLMNEHFWVEPSWRKGGTAAKLLAAAKARARGLGRPLWLDLTYGADGASEEKDRFVRSMGFGYCGGKFTLLRVSEPDAQITMDFQSVA